MDREEIYKVVASEEALQSFDGGEINQVVKQFPYFQSARILLLKKMKLDNDTAFEKELKQSAVYIGDRAKLYTYLHPFKGIVQEDEPVDFLSKDHQESFMPVADFSMEGGAGFDPLFLSPDQLAAPVKRSADPLADLEAQPQVDVAKPAEGWDLIDQFVNSDTKKIKVSDSSGSPIVNLAESSAKENHTILTETLASIYIKQKKYDKAIGIFESLSLKFPEKSAFFAARIGELELVQKNT